MVVQGNGLREKGSLCRRRESALQHHTDKGRFMRLRTVPARASELSRPFRDLPLVAKRPRRADRLLMAKPPGS